mmetsp:Transcript_19501/g.22696  ORF Transcript_19501/g.22696 Transcript_19501/m.22696 type:complete len:124 (+) Transcript_19501:867-1238(+)
MKTYMDVGHNEPAVKNLIKSIELIDGKDVPIYVVTTFSSNKDVKVALTILMQKAVDIRMVLIPHYRLCKLDEINAIIKAIKEPNDTETNVLHAIEFEGDLPLNVKETLLAIDRIQHENAVLLF